MFIGHYVLDIGCLEIHQIPHNFITFNFSHFSSLQLLFRFFRGQSPESPIFSKFIFEFCKIYCKLNAIMKIPCFAGLDAGSVSIKLAVFIDKITNANPSEIKNIPSNYCLHETSAGLFLLSDAIRHKGEPVKCARNMLTRLQNTNPELAISGMAATGGGGRDMADQMGLEFINEFQSAAEGLRLLHPEARTVFELGGERSKYMLLGEDSEGDAQILDYEMNGECAAGTGSFFDQQAGRLKYDVNEVSSVLANVKRTASIAGRCSVFAKSDMIHAQQRGYSPPEVLKGLCFAVVRNFKGNVTKGKKIIPPVAFIGGVASNAGVVDAVRELFELHDGQLVVPELNDKISAAGAAWLAKKRNLNTILTLDFNHKSRTAAYPKTIPLSMDKVILLRDQEEKYIFKSDDKINAFLGIDIGSVSTNLALIDEEGKLIHGIYKMTDGRPLEVVGMGLKEMADAAGSKVIIKAVGTTGSGRELIGALVGADAIKDEITAHKTGSAFISKNQLKKEVDTIFEIGGQDSKYISIKNGTVVDFSLNEACAAGTGSFLEEQAKELGVAIKNEFAELALKSRHPLKLGERCTVFMEKELLPYQHRGVPKEDMVAGLAFSVVYNYLNRVVKKRPIGDVVFFQGGTAYNDAVAAAFATILDKSIVVPPYNGIMGAIGAALLAKDLQILKTGFRGWDVDRIKWDVREFTCNGCVNHCIIQEFDVEGEKSYWGDKCSDRFRKRVHSDKKPVIDNLFDIHSRLLDLDYLHFLTPAKQKRGIAAIPRILNFYDRLPFWRAYFEALGFQVITSGSSLQSHVDSGVEASVAEPCFPVQMAHGHVLELSNREIDILFLPNVINEEDTSNSVASFICPWTQTFPLIAENTPSFFNVKHKIWDPNIQFREGQSFVCAQLESEVKKFGISASENSRAVALAYNAQAEFYKRYMKEGENALKIIKENGASCVLLLGRPYNLYDSGLNLNIPAKLRLDYGVNVLPLDSLSLDEIDVRPVHDHMFWNYGRRIIQAAMRSKQYPDMHLIYLSNFKCGPDSYIRHYIEEAAGKSFLFLQLDSHANDAGMMTRIEAFLESKKMLR